MLKLTKDRVAAFFNQAGATLGKTPEQIYPIFPDAIFKHIKLDGKTNSVLEISTTYFTLSCHLDKSNRCISAYIFINKEEELEAVKLIIKYCNWAFPYSFILKMWVMNELSVDIQPTNGYIMFSISKLEYLTSDFIKCLTSEGFITH